MTQKATCKYEYFNEHNYINDISGTVNKSFSKIAPFWPLKNLIAVNPLQGFEDLPIEEALETAATYFQQQEIPKEMEAINRETIKWLQVYLDEGQATITMPLKYQGFYPSWKKLALYDTNLHKNDKQKKEWLKKLPKNAEQAIIECLKYLNIKKEETNKFLTLLLTTLPGWSAYIKYRTEWAALDTYLSNPICQNDYLAIRLIITTLLWPEGKKLIDFHKEIITKSQSKGDRLETIQATEKTYRQQLLQNLAKQSIKTPSTPEAQLVFCIDVRSESFRKNLESIGNYQTYGFAGFFGIPAKITNTITNESYSSCPVLISPKHEIKESSCSQHSRNKDLKGYSRLSGLKNLYQSLKYTFITPFALVECIGPISGIWMGLRCLAPKSASKLKSALFKLIHKPEAIEPSINSISFTDQYAYAENALKMIGLTNNFAPIIVFCGHGSTTENNAYATALDCGACGGRHGGSNARILAAILNRSEIKKELAKNGIHIPENTHFIAAEHNTTTDQVTLYNTQHLDKIDKLKADLKKAGEANSLFRFRQMENNEKVLKKLNAVSYTWLRSQDWAQVRPEWGLARNAAFIIAPRDITSSLSLDGRCFLHSYDYKQDLDGRYLTIILTAPMVVAQWINTQYLFSTIDNIAYGGGSKITKNITGKIGIMQGNASDLMTGLPLQSVYRSDTEAYHEPQRLLTVVLAPRNILKKIIHDQPALKKLFGNGWVQLSCIEPDNRKIYLLNRDFTWKEMN